MNAMNSISGSNYYSQLASGKRLQSEKDDAAGMAIVQEENAQISGYEAGSRNAEDAQSVLNISDGALGSISDSLQRMRELAVQASNSAFMSRDDKQAIQDEVDQLKQGISDIAKNTQFNTKNLLDGSNSSMHVASNPDGSGADVDTGNATLEALGIADFDVTGNFSIKTIDNAIKKVSANRSSIGAQSNSMDAAIGYNSQTLYNLSKATSQKQDTNFEKAATEKDKENILQTYRFMMQRQQMQQEQSKIAMLYM